MPFTMQQSVPNVGHEEISGDGFFVLTVRDDLKSPVHTGILLNPTQMGKIGCKAHEHCVSSYHF